MNDFEKKLEQQKVRCIPNEWRQEILKTLPSHSPTQTRGLLATVQEYAIAVLWPHPKAWAGLAAVWFFILVFNASTRNESPQVIAATQSKPAEYLRALQEKRQLLVQLFNESFPHPEPPAADRPRPRTEYVNQTAYA